MGSATGSGSVGSLCEVFMVVDLLGGVRGRRRRSGAPAWGGGLFEVAGVLAAVGGHGGDHEDGGLVGGQIGVVQNLLAEVRRIGAVVERTAHVVGVGNGGLGAVVGDAFAA